jgi:hypothetical protein
VRGGTLKQFKYLVAVRPVLNFRDSWTSNGGAKTEVFVQCSWIDFVLFSKFITEITSRRMKWKVYV